MSDNGGKPAVTRRELERLLQPVLEDGDSFLVEKAEGTVTIAPSPESIPSKRSPLQKSHPELYGRLLAVNQRLSDAMGCGVGFVILLGVLGLCFAIHAQAFHGLAADGSHAQHVLEQLRTWWIYVIIVVVGLAAYLKLESSLEASAFARQRPSIQEAYARADLSLFELLSRMEGDEGLGTVAKHLKRDLADDHY